MLMDGLDGASAASEVGSESASQFNSEYSRFFGQPPMRDIRTLRSPSALPLESRHLRYFPGSVSPGRSSSHKILAIQKRPCACTIWMELTPRANGLASFASCRLS